MPIWEWNWSANFLCICTLLVYRRWREYEPVTGVQLLRKAKNKSRNDHQETPKWPCANLLGLRIMFMPLSPLFVCNSLHLVIIFAHNALSCTDATCKWIASCAVELIVSPLTWHSKSFTHYSIQIEAILACNAILRKKNQRNDHRETLGGRVPIFWGCALRPWPCHLCICITLYIDNHEFRHFLSKLWHKEYLKLDIYMWGLWYIGKHILVGMIQFIWLHSRFLGYMVLLWSGFLFWGTNRQMSDWKLNCILTIGNRHPDSKSVSSNSTGEVCMQL